MRHNIPMNRLKLTLFLLTLLFANSIFAEEDSWYQVELIVFERPLPELDGEQWQIMMYQPRASMVELIPVDETGIEDELIPFSALPVSRNRLSGTERVLKLSSAYQPIMHYSWQQPAYERNQARFVHIQKLSQEMVDVTDDANELSNDITLLTTTELIEDEPAFIESIAAPDYLIDGAVRIRSGFYLHVDVDLFYFAAIPEQNRIVQTMDVSETVDPFQKYPIQLKETRRIKLNELHYFDHPMFGMIIQVSRLETE